MDIEINKAVVVVPFFSWSGFEIKGWGFCNLFAIFI